MATLSSPVWGNTSFTVLSDHYEQVSPTICGYYPYVASYCMDWSPSSCYHPGMDITMPRGTTVYAPKAGVITCAGTGVGDGYDGAQCQAFADSSGAYGSGRVEVYFPDDDSVAIYGHCSAALLPVGTQVAAGDAVAESGTDNSDHLHFELRVRNSTCTNGYAIVDPRPLLTGGGTPPSTPSFTSGDRIAVDDGPLNMRSQPTTSSSIITTLPEGTDLCVVFSEPTSADGYTWYSVATLDAQNLGYVAGEFCRIDAIGGCTTFDPHDRIEVADGPLNLRQGPGENYAVVTSLSVGTQMCVSENFLGVPFTNGGYDWYLVDVNGVDGYVAGAFCSLDQAGGCGP